MAFLKTESPAPLRVTQGILDPLAYPVFGALLAVSFASNIGTWVQDVGSSWLMTSLAPSPVMVSLIQTAGNLPYFLLALLAGTLADIADRRRLLIVSQLWMLASAGSLAILTLLHLTTPWILLGMSFSLGLGAALGGPAFQATVPELVPRDDVLGAVALNSMQFNIARGIGPAIGGIIVSAWGAGFAFLTNALSFVGVTGVLISWRRQAHKSVLPAERVYGGIRAGIRYVRYSPVLRAVLVRSFLFGVSASALWAVLPLAARIEFHADAAGYGVIVAFFGIGAAACGFGFSKLRRLLSTDWVAMSGGLTFALANALVASAHQVALLWIATFLAGAAWVAVTATLNSSAQMALPAWVRARALSLYLLALQGGLALGSIGWGYLASQVGIRSALDASALLLALNVLIVMRLSLSGAEDFDPRPWSVQGVPHLDPGPAVEQGPVMIYLEFQVEPAHAAEFEQAMRQLEPIRRRDGAVMWSFFSDISDPRRYVEAYMVETWGEHVRQHYRGTVSDSEAWQRVRSFHIGPEPPRVLHLIAPVMATHVTLAMRRTSDTGEWPTVSMSATGTGKQS
jgi:MFS family permease/quinol monooxygenase YgiN